VNENAMSIQMIQVDGFPRGRRKDGAAVAAPGLILVRWKAEESDRLVQAYVNRRWAGTSATPGQRMMLVECEGDHPAAIELIEVEAKDRYSDFSGELQGFRRTDGAHAMMEWCRRGDLALGSEVRIYWDGGEGTVDFGRAIAVQEVWRDASEKWGWGLEGFGRGDFGYCGANAPGLGLGCFGEGEFGFDAGRMFYRSEALAAGRYRFAAQLIDARGNAAGEAEIFEVYIDPIPSAPSLALERYDAGTGELTLVVE
jgi:hypothetical protein